MRHACVWGLLVALPLCLAACAGGGGSGVDSPFFDDASGRRTGTVDGYLAAPVASGSQGPAALAFLPYPPNQLTYRIVDNTRVTLSTGQTAVTDARGLYLFPSVRSGTHTISASDPTGAYTPAAGEIVVEPGAITCGLDEPTPSPEAPAAGFFATGADDFLRLRSAVDTREWRRMTAAPADTAGAYRFAFAVPGDTEPETYLDLSFDANGVRLRGGPWGTLDPYGPLMRSGIRLSDTFSLPSTLTAPDTSQHAARTTATITGVDDLVLSAGRFDNCARLVWSMSADTASENWTMWLAWRVGPVKLTWSGLDYQLQYGEIGGKEYR